ncbi:hypothetical protein [Paracidovorax konjaci]|uniref:Uncharacterized protein n=1 Tax=Paracidovorax konjaci TaxID=32040 RepID=A0A1I1XR89_9BURK|nr:hypothetical protein [Paracidovorax konjaci]SFE09814.1 hypothetical protein SAMN04489710_11467 [Paracidovorax konjaci]
MKTPVPARVGLLPSAEIDLSDLSEIKTLVAKCECEQAIADGYPTQTMEPRWWQQAHMHFF